MSIPYGNEDSSGRHHHANALLTASPNQHNVGTLANNNDGCKHDDIATTTGRMNHPPPPPLQSTSFGSISSSSLCGSSSSKDDSSDHDRILVSDSYCLDAQKRTCELKDDYQGYIASIEGSGSGRSRSRGQRMDDYCLAAQRRTCQIKDEYQEFVASIEGSGSNISSRHDQLAAQEPALQHVDDDDERYSTARTSGQDDNHPRSHGMDPPGIKGLKSKDRRVSMNFDTLPSSRNEVRRGHRTNLGNPNPTRASKNRRRTTDNVPQLLWEDEMNVFDMTSDSRVDKRRGCWYSPWLDKRVATLTVTMIACLLALIIGLLTRGKEGEGSIINHERLRLPARTSKKLPTSDDDIITSSNSPITSFDRSQGWTGQTYQQAMDFCTSKSASLCDYQTICPYGPGSKPHLPHGGFYDQDDSSPINGGNPNRLAWVATSSSDNVWIQVGAKDQCLKYDFIHGGPPMWGVTGEENEEITRHILCCPPTSTTTNDANEEEGVDHPHDVTTNTAKDPPSIPVMYHQEFLDPLWYNVNQGWNGSTFEEARRFCSTLPESRFPCPYEAYCPRGPHHPPTLGGPPQNGEKSEGNNENEEDDGVTPSSSWSPIMDEVGHGLVQLLAGGDGGGSGSSSDEDALCKVSYLTLGVGGVGLRRPDDYPMTHIMCCRLFDEEL